MARMTPEQLRRRQQVERVIRVAAPALNLVLRLGERLSKVIEPEDMEYYPPRVTSGKPSPPPPRVEDGGRD
jgi:hypothetical protein